MANLEEDVKLDNLIRTVDSRKSSNEFLGFNITNTETLNLTLTTDVGGFRTVVTSTLSNDEGLKVFGIPFVSLYKDSVSDANLIHSGSNVGNVEFFTSYWFDWGASNNNNQKFKIYIGKSGIASPQPIVVKIFWRTLFEDVTVAVSED